MLTYHDNSKEPLLPVDVEPVQRQTMFPRQPRLHYRALKELAVAARRDRATSAKTNSEDYVRRARSDS
eukprot:4726482-Lingulodinium_polyedra.AAC.1